MEKVSPADPPFVSLTDILAVDWEEDEADMFILV